MTTEINLTAASHALFMALWNDAGNWSGSPLFGGDKASKGNLTDLKKKGLLTTTQDEENPKCQWVTFTEAGEAYGALHSPTPEEQADFDQVQDEAEGDLGAQLEAEQPDVSEAERVAEETPKLTLAEIAATYRAFIESNPAAGVCASIRYTAKAHPAASKAEMVAALEPLGLNKITIGIQRLKASKG